MRLSFNEIRARAADFAEKYANATYERGETQSFYNDFFQVFDVQRRKVASFEAPVKLLGEKRGFIDLFWKGVLLVEQKSAGRDLKKAKTQALDYFPGLKDAELPRYILLSDFQTFELHDLEEGTEISFPLAELHKNIEHFLFIMGVQKRVFRDQDPVNVEAANLMGRLHDALYASGYHGHDLEQLLVRIVFCLFADDTGIFDERGVFLDLIRDRTAIDGADTGAWLIQLFEVLNTPDKPVNKRQKTLDEDLAKFPYVNGALFKERLPIPAFDAAMRALLLEACDFNWDAISPAIFGSLFQSVMDKKARRAAGAHYTTEKNILKLIEPLFMDDLRAEFKRILMRRGTGRVQALKAFQDKLASLTFFDPACGCGNFLIIAYRELRLLELEVIKALYTEKRDDLFIAQLSKVDVSQFYGIEISEFPARIAEVALWMMDHIMNNRLALAFGKPYARIPLTASPHIHHADALELDWEGVLPASQCSYVLGNPPFIGQSFQSPLQRAQMARVIGAKNGRAGSLDYVTAWFLKAGAYLSPPLRGGEAEERSGVIPDAPKARAGIQKNNTLDSRSLLRSVGNDRKTPAPSIAFVATNSITQGEQVAQLWPTLFERYGLEITFAHRTFEWGSEAPGKAHVHVVIIGLARRMDAPDIKRLFSYESIKGEPKETQHSSLSPYLIDASQLANRHIVVRETRTPPGQIPVMRMGSKIVDGGHLIFSDDERVDFLKQEPAATPYFCPLMGSEEYINGKSRWILSLDGVAPNVLRSMPLVVERLARVKAFRLASKKVKTQDLADYPTRFEVMTIPKSTYLVVPEVSSERRDYIPIGWLCPPTIPSNKLLIVQDARLIDFAILTSAMHIAWTEQVGGRLESRYQYSPGIVYNTFPWPEADAKAQKRIEALAQKVLDARAAHPNATLADLYDPDVMPPDLRKAHKALDQAVDALYRPTPFASDRERVEHLFMLYEKLSAPMLVAASTKPKRRHKA